MTKKTNPPVNLKEIVVDHLTANMDLLMGDNRSAERAYQLLESLSQLALSVAESALTNRVHLSALQTRNLLIQGDAELDESPTAKYQLGFRQVDVVGGEVKSDQLYTRKGAIEKLGDDFVNNHWGEMGEKCPRKVNLSDDHVIWFYSVRLPANEVTAELNDAHNPSTSGADLGM